MSAKTNVLPSVEAGLETDRMTPQPPSHPSRTPRWPWLVLVLGLAWTVMIRVPLILHAPEHLDSDLAVDGLTLLDAVHGQWRWHFPGTPHMGITPVLLSYPQALIFGAGPRTLVSGGTVAWLLVVLATFELARRAFGASVAGWAIVPLVVSSVGTVWLSGRITGGHLLTFAWHTAAFVGLSECLTRGGTWRSAMLGLWCGLGLYLDTMFTFTMAGVVPAAVLGWWSLGRSRTGLKAAALFLVGLGIGLAPKEVGKRVDPYDAYQEQFSPVFEPSVLADHARILALKCLPRLIAGHELPDFQASPRALSASGRPIRQLAVETPREPNGPIATVLSLSLFGASVVRLMVDRPGAGGVPRRAVQRGLLLSSLLIVAAFLANRNIFDSDNYRYLIYLLVPWAIGYGLLMQSIARRGMPGRLLAVVMTGLLTIAMTASIAGWYIRLGWIDDSYWPTRGPSRPWNQIQVTKGTSRLFMGGQDSIIPPGTTHVFGDYWDVYRISFLSGGRVVGVPYPTYPNRFPGWSRGLGPGQGRLMVLNAAAPWRELLAEVWKREGRDPDELDQLAITVP